ncbi:MAG: methionine adenosyltransferase [Chlorobiales bacterium]|nr:methionine adenosyltransferase [Chlorobiales bacterium]
MDITRNIVVDEAGTIPADMQLIELIERKGTGHPDTICDSIMEAICISLCREYLALTGHILHHNIDKGLLVAGKTIVKPGGGTVLEPLKIIFGDRATDKYNGIKIPVGEIAEAAAKTWLKDNLRFVNPEAHVLFQNEIKSGSVELTDLFARSNIGANDTSVGVGYAPLSSAESLVLDTERFMNSCEFKQTFPETGEDIKIMGYRNRKTLTLTIAVAFIDRYILNTSMYFERKNAIIEALQIFISTKTHHFENIIIDVNTLDDPSRGENGIYLTVLGTSAEGADGGEVGRGNRVNGLISFGRPLSLEAAAGKNPVNHVGKIYNILAREIASRLYREVNGINEVSVFLCSQIGKPLDQPLIASARIIPDHNVSLENIREPVTKIIDAELADIYHFTGRLAQGEFTVC